MNPILEAMARAHWNYWDDDITPWEDLHHLVRVERCNAERAALIALRDCSKPKAAAALMEHVNGGMWTWEGALDAAINAILEEG